VQPVACEGSSPNVFDVSNARLYSYIADYSRSKVFTFFLRHVLDLQDQQVQEVQLSQRDRATAAWVSFGQNITGKGYSAQNLIGLYSTTVT